VFDQFEQWLQARPMEPDAELVRALRQCDGRRVAALLLVRDDFWMATTRLLRAVEAPLVEGANSAAVELFDARHTRQVLEKFGQALGQIPSAPAAATGKTAAFLDEAVRGLVSDDGRLTPVRLNLFVEVVRRRVWTTATLAELGGVEGIGVKFLEESFDAVGALPSRRLHRKAAESVLRLLLPPPSSMIRGAPRPVQALREASGYSDRPDDFADLMQLLDHDLRLISATDPQEFTPAEPEPRRNHQVGPGDLSYQLAHDYLIRPIRQWLERNERSTRAGRARLRLDAVTSTWMARPGSHQLPSLLEYLGILCHTQPGEWSSDQQLLMRAAGRHLVGRTMLVVALLGAIGIGGKFLIDKEQARSTLSLALAAHDRELPAIISKLEPHYKLIMSELEARAADERTSDHAREVASVLLYRFSPTRQRGQHMRMLLLGAPGPERVELIRSALAARPEHADVDELRVVLSEQTGNLGIYLRATCALAKLDRGVLAGSPQMDALLAQALLAEDRRDVPRWLDLLGPFVSRLLTPLGEYCRDRQTDPDVRLIAAEALAEALKRRGDSETLARAIVEAQPDASQFLLRELGSTANRGWAIAYLDTLLKEEASRVNQASHPVDERTFGRQVHAAMALMALGQPDTLWSMLRHRADPRMRTLLIQRLAGSSLLRENMHQRLAAPDLDPLERQALLLIWAETARGGVAASAVNDVVKLAQRLYLDDPDSGVHSAAELLLRRWKHGDLIELAEQQLRQQPRRPPGRRWELGPSGHTFAIVAGPLEFWMGSPDHEEDRFSHETRHFRRIERSLAVATKEVTIEQYRRFKPAFPQEYRYSREANCPANLVNWFEAAAYCNWLSRQDGIEKGEWCYPAKVESGMEVSERAASRLGYRLPTEAEWEYLCRAGSETARSFDPGGEVFSHHAWTWLNSEDRCRPVGSLLPNALGLFDMLGNLWEWCHYNPVMSGKDDYPPYPASTKDIPALDVDGSSTIIARQTWRILRGGAFDYSPAQARSAHRYSATVGYREGTIGFRVVRTIPTPSK
jgi:formylglycine-generating enzyme required for sulfatase activity